MNEGEEQYADVEGVTVWEGMVEVPEETISARDHKGHVDVDRDRWIVKTPNGWTVIWKGEVPIGESVISRQSSTLTNRYVR